VVSSSSASLFAADELAASAPFPSLKTVVGKDLPLFFCLFFLFLCLS
jgi:hypothetical protein